LFDRSLCRIGVFYDGCYFTYARRHFYFERQIGWLEFKAFHGLLENYIRSKEQGYTHYRGYMAHGFKACSPPLMPTRNSSGLTDICITI